MKTKLAKETLLNQSKSELIDFLIQKNQKNLLNSIDCSAACISGGGF